MRTETDLLHGSIGDKLIRIALPLAATAVLQQLFNAADIAVVGRFVGEAAMAAVGTRPVVRVIRSKRTMIFRIGASRMWLIVIIRMIFKNQQ